MLDILRGIRKISGSNVPVLAWNTGSLNAILHYFGPPSLGGLGNLPLKAEELAKETGKPYYDILGEVSYFEILPTHLLIACGLCQLYQPHAGEVVELPGLPPMYDYEFNSHHIDVRISYGLNTLQGH